MDITINSQDDLIKACDLLHDAIVRDEDIYYNSSDNEVKIIAKRNSLPEREVVKNYKLFRKCSYSIIPSKLHLKRVVYFHKVTKGSLKVHTFNECRINTKENAYEFNFSEVLTLKIKFEKAPMGNFADINDNKNEKGIFWEFSIPFWFSKR